MILCFLVCTGLGLFCMLSVLNHTIQSFPFRIDLSHIFSMRVDPGSIPGLGRSPGQRNGNPLQYSCLRNPIDGGDWQATAHGVAKSKTWLSDFIHFISYFSIKTNWNKNQINVTLYNRIDENVSYIFFENMKVIYEIFRNKKGPSSQGYGFSSSHIWMWELNYKESWAQNNWYFWTVVLGKTLESPLDCKETTQSILKEISPGCSWKDWCWSWNSSTFATWCEELTHWKRPWCWERLKVGGKGDDRGWDGWMTSQTQWTWVWVTSRSWWWKGGPDMLQSMGSQGVRHDWVTELNWTLQERVGSEWEHC